MTSIYYHRLKSQSILSPTLCHLVFVTISYTLLSYISRMRAHVCNY